MPKFSRLLVMLRYLHGVRVRLWTAFVATLCLLLATGGAFAQMTPQQQQQLPPSDPNSPQYNTVYLPSLQAGQAPRTRWEDRWGAISDDGNGVFGIVSDMESEQSAKQNAIQECKKKRRRQMRGQPHLPQPMCGRGG